MFYYFITKYMYPCLLQARSEFYRLYRESQLSSGVRYVPEAPLVYDSVWTLALALNSTIANENAASNSCTSGLPLDQFTYSSALLGTEIGNAVSDSNFNGASVSLLPTLVIYCQQILMRKPISFDRKVRI